MHDYDTLVRWGGEDFLAVLPFMSPSHFTATMRRLRYVMQELMPQ
jgi:GGDEF domain-containing protein